MSALRSMILDEHGRPMRSLLIDQGPSRARMTGYQVGDGIRGTLVRSTGPEQRSCSVCKGTIRQAVNGAWGHAQNIRSHKAQP